MSENGLENFANVVTVLAACGGVFIAWLGLSTWKKQIKWQQDQELVRRILKLIFTYRNAFLDARSPWFPGWETSEDGEAEEINETPEHKYRMQFRAHRKRLNRFLSLKPAISSDVIEAEVLWDTDLGQLWDKTLRLESEYLNEFETFSDYSKPSNERRLQGLYTNKDDQLRGYSVVFSRGAANDEFGVRLRNSIEAIRNYLKGKIGESR